MINRSCFSNSTLLVFFALVTGLFASDYAYASLSANMNQITYPWGSTLTVSGIIPGSDAAAITATIYNSTGVAATLSGTSSGGPINKFSLSTAVNASFSPGDYLAKVSGGNSSVNMSFNVVPEVIALESYLVGSGNQKSIINVTTPVEINTSGAMGGNFSELISLSKTGKVHYGNYSLGEKMYHFVLVDETSASNYDRLYVDDDKNFQLGNDTEDVGAGSDVEYQSLKKSGVFSNGTGTDDFKYVVGDIERATGDEVILWAPKGDVPATSDAINLIVVAKNETDFVSKQVKVEIYNSTGQNVTPPYYMNSSQMGWFNMTVSNLSAGTYTVKLNDTLGILTFSVEAFKLFASIADTSNNPSYKFSPNSKVRLMLTSRNSTGPFNLTTFTASLHYPNGTTASKGKASFTHSADGVYYYDYDMAQAPTGAYSASVAGSDASGNSQTAYAGFEVQSVGFDAQAINVRYIEEADSSGAMVDAFSTSSNITIMTFLTNISAGGMMAKGPEGFAGLVAPADCNSSVSLIGLKDENGVSYTVNYQAMNLSSAMALLGGPGGGEAPPQQMLSQCMLLFPAPNKSGSTFRAEIRMAYQGEEKYAGVMFGVQKLYARGSTVDFKGEDFSFLAPNSTVRINLKVTDLDTDQQLSGDSILSAKIISLQKVFPSFKDVLANTTLRGLLNESVANGTISFNSPLDEGFYSMKFRFTANASGGSVETGIGDAFFMLKKYMVWGQLSGAQEGKWYVKQGQNATLEVNVLDIDKAQTIFGGYNSQKTCTGCTGFIVNVSGIRNDQQFKTITEYSVLLGTIINSTNPVANITIIPGPGMQTGWYSIDLAVTDPATNASYFGWGGFEIRNFWVETTQAIWNSTKYYVLAGPGMGGAEFDTSAAVEFAVMPRDPSNPGMILGPTSVAVESIQAADSWPPVPISGYAASVASKSIDVCFATDQGPGNCMADSVYVVNVSGLPLKQGNYMANVRVNINGTSDIGTFRFSKSSYGLWTDYRKNSFPPLYASSENLTVNFTGLTLDGKSPHNITNVTIEDVFSPKMGKPIKVKYGQNYTVNCNLSKSEYGKTWQYCLVDLMLTTLPASEYNVRYAIVDSPTADYQKTAEIFFKVQGTIVSIPSIEEGWIWQSGAISKKIDMDVRRGEWSWCQEAKSSVPGQYKFCGDYSQNNGQGPPQQQQFNLTVQNVTSTKEIFGYIPMSGNSGGQLFGNVVQKQRMCLYANGSHLWINATAFSAGVCDLTKTTPIAVGVGTFTDSMGGLWRLDTIGDQSITVTGLNTLYETGALVNTSFTRSGIIKFGRLDEANLGAFTKGQGGSGERKGIDLNGDGYTNGSVYFAISDNATGGVYDMFFFSANASFTAPISVNDPNRTRREFGSPTSAKDRLTLLSIDPRAQSLKFYSKQVGDWAHLGDIKWTANVTIPVLVTSPDGTPQSENVSITGYKNTRTWQMVQTALVSNRNITGVGEITLNTSLLGNAGDYSFAIATSTDKVDEWKWPMATVRKFLVDGEVGEALYVTAADLKPLPLQMRGWESGVTRMWKDNRNNTPGFDVDGVLAHAGEINAVQEGCQVFNATNNITLQILQDTPAIYGFMRDNSQENNGYFLYNSTIGGGPTSQRLYWNATGCRFNVTQGAMPSYLRGQYLTLNKDKRQYNMSVLAIDKDVYNYNNWTVDDVYFANTSDCYNFEQTPAIAVFTVSNSTPNVTVPPGAYNWTATTICINSTAWANATYNITYQWLGRSWRADFGVAGLNSSAILPMANNTMGDPQWSIEWGYMQNVSIFGSYYDIILANETNYTYQRCAFEPSPDGQCVKKAWLVPTAIGNFSSPQARGVTVRQNFTNDLYIASVGPMDGEGVTVGNFSALGALHPGIGMIPLADNAPAYFVTLSESVRNYDFNKDGSKNATFYMLAFDSDFNSIPAPTSTMIDDDLNMLMGTLNIGGNETAYDFTGNEEGGMNEQWGGLPTGIYNGNAQFGANKDNTMWENQPNWNIPLFNASDKMILEKSQWLVGLNQSVDVLLKVFNFDQRPIAGANISVVQMARASFMGFQVLAPSAYIANTTYNVTDQYGYGLLKLSPFSGSWENANYQVLINVQTSQGSETFERWFNAGVFGGP